MADLNKMVEKLSKDCSDINERLQAVYKEYDQVYVESQRELSASRRVSGGSMEGLYEFQIFSQILRRNRDIVLSLMKGMRNLRPLNKYQFIEEDVKPLRANKSKKDPEILPAQVENLEISETVEDMNG